MLALLAGPALAWERADSIGMQGFLVREPSSWVTSITAPSKFTASIVSAVYMLCIRRDKYTSVTLLCPRVPDDGDRRVTSPLALAQVAMGDACQSVELVALVLR